MRASSYLWGVTRRLWRGLCSRGRSSRQLRVAETLSLGDRRFVAVIECERQKFLIGGAGNSVVVLAALSGGELAHPPADEDTPIFHFARGAEGQRLERTS